MSTHEIINARVASEGKVFLTIRWDDTGHQTTERTSVEVAKALGWQRPDPQPVDPAWMVGLAMEASDEWRAEPVSDTCLRALRLALSRGHVVLASVMPSEEEMLKDAREDAAQCNDQFYPDIARMQRSGERNDDEIKSALQARRNVYASLGSVARPAVSSGPVVPKIDLEAAVMLAWGAGANACGEAIDDMLSGRRKWTHEWRAERSKSDVSAILENLKSGEA